MKMEFLVHPRSVFPRNIWHFIPASNAHGFITRCETQLVTVRSYAQTVLGGERERERDRETERQRQRQRQTDRQTETERHRERQTDRQRQTETETEFTE